jgi:hypothetical protein
MKCPFCGEAAKTVVRTATYRRGNRTVQITSECYSCPGSCNGPSGEKPFLFHDPPQLRLNDKMARETWLTQYGEPMPKPAFPRKG